MIILEDQKRIWELSSHILKKSIRCGNVADNFPTTIASYNLQLPALHFPYTFSFGHSTFRYLQLPAQHFHLPSASGTRTTSLYLHLPALHFPLPSTSGTPLPFTFRFRISISLYLQLPALHFMLPSTSGTPLPVNFNFRNSTSLYLQLPALHFPLPSPFGTQLLFTDTLHFSPL